MALANTIATLAGIKADIKSALTAKLGASPGDSFAGYAPLILANWPSSIEYDYETVQAILSVKDTDKTGRVHFNQSAAECVSIDWGDGTVETADAAGEVTKTHEYASAGNYKVTLTRLDGTVSLLSDAIATTGGNKLNSVKQLYIGNYFSAGAQAFNGQMELSAVRIDYTNISIGNFAFSGCSNALISLPSGYAMNNVGESAFANTLLKTVRLKGVVYDNALYQCFLLSQANLNEVTQIESQAFAYCTRMASVDMPAAITKIGGSAFKDCNSLKSVTCRATVPPTLGSNAFPASVTEILVPSDSVAAYQAATNWSAYASIIQAIS